ncbi:peroxisomal membrane protein PEX16-like [Penaeus monodon]|uniref:peroxisomal membrane protein PEX16-like n=1 Tax=Penaeus monodon TaxID=6687 RepID=UPI0018A7375E|nr:peroxisomal membrane protein PEX16-like [Penaeus monodon]
MASKMQDCYQWFLQYKKWVMNNPQGASEMESVVKWGSYFLAGRFKNSTLLCEIVYSGSRLFEMFNDFLVRGTLPKLTSKQGDKLKVFLTILEYVEVLVEVAAVQLWGEMGRWAVVAIIQLTKCIGRFFLVLKYKTSLVSSPPIKPLDRRAVIQTRQQMYSNQSSTPESFRLPHSGRIMRTLAGAPPTHQRTFNPPQPPNNNENETVAQKMLSPKQLTAEALHILRPIGHLTSMYLFGKQSWAPWVLALGMDITSLNLYNESMLSAAERSELARRRISLLYYLVRSPAFHAVTHKRIKYFLTTVGNRVPLARTICQPLLEYIPEWQKIYAYTWS